jgi:hypothetical protein
MIDRFVYIYCSLYLLFSLTNSRSINFDLSEVETRLIRILLNESTYSKKVRPSYKVTVDIRFIFNQILSMVEKEQIIVTNCFVDQKWTGNNQSNFQFFTLKKNPFLDPRLMWNPLDFYNITWIRMPATSVWYD